MIYAEYILNGVFRQFEGTKKEWFQASFNPKIEILCIIDKK